MKNIKDLLIEAKKWIPKEEWIKQQRETKQKNTCAFNDYEDVTQEMIDKFWSQERYAEKLVDEKNIRKEWKAAYDTAKKNTAMLDYAMTPGYTVYFDKNANLLITINHGASWSNQNHLQHYADKCKKYFKLDSMASGYVDNEKWELLFDGKKK